MKWGVGGRAGGDSVRTVSLQKNTGEFWGVGADWTPFHLVCLGGYTVIYMGANSQNYTLKCIRLTVNKICGNGTSKGCVSSCRPSCSGTGRGGRGPRRGSLREGALSAPGGRSGGTGLVCTDTRSHLSSRDTGRSHSSVCLPLSEPVLGESHEVCLRGVPPLVPVRSVANGCWKSECPPVPRSPLRPWLTGLAWDGVVPGRRLHRLSETLL